MSDRTLIIIPDTGPLIHLAAGGVLDILPALGRVLLPDVIALEATRYRSKPMAPEIAAWLSKSVVQPA